MPHQVRVSLGSLSDRELANVFLGILHATQVYYDVSVGSCHWSAGDEFTEYANSIEENIIVVIGGHSLAAPGILSGTLRNLGKFYKTTIAVPLDESAQRAIEDLPPGTPVLTCGFNKSDVKASIINAALAVAGIISKSDPTVYNALSKWYENKKKEKEIKYITLKEGLIPEPEKKKEA